MLAALLAQIAVVYEPTMQKLFHTTDLHEFQWERIILTASSVFVVVELDKWLRNRAALRRRHQGYVSPIEKE